jgi:APA family basic amino acid/polyamine antiporter
VSAEPSTRSLDRRLGPLDAAAIVVSNVIGVGIFTTPGIIAQIVPHPVAMLSVWLAGGLLAFAGAMAYAELAALRPRAGGEYIYLREAFGPLAGFLTGWTSFVAGFAGAIAAGAVGAAEYLGRFIPAAADATPWLSIPLGVATLQLTPKALVALSVVWGLSLIHLRGVGPGRLVQNTLATIKVVALMIFVALGIAYGSGSTAHFTEGTVPSPGTWLLAMIPVMFSYSGWNAAAYVAEEIRDPGRNVPKALALGTAAVVAVYLGINILYLYALPISEFVQLGASGQVTAGAVVAERLLGPVAADALSVLTIIIVIGGVSAMVFAGPRIYYAMARDKSFVGLAARVHPRFHTPAASIVSQALWTSVLILSGTFFQLLSYTGFAVVLFAGVAVAALFVMRWKHPDEPRPFRALGYPVAPAIFTIASFAMVVNAIREQPGTSLAGLGLMAAGLPIYYWLHRSQERPKP